LGPSTKDDHNLQGNLKELHILFTKHLVGHELLAEKSNELVKQIAIKVVYLQAKDAKVFQIINSGLK
jgi:hypothetical protein